MEEQAIGMKGHVGLAKKPIGPNTLASKIAEELAASKVLSTFVKLYFTIKDDTLIVKEKANTNQTMHRFYFSKMSDFGVVPSTNCMYFTYGKDVFVLKTENELDLLSWIKTLVFLQEESLKSNQPLEFNKFEVNADVREQLFMRDEPNYTYDSIKVTQKKKKQEEKVFDLSKMKVEDGCEGKVNRSDEELSAGSDDSEDGHKPATLNSAPSKKEPDASGEADDGTWNKAMKWMGF